MISGNIESLEDISAVFTRFHELWHNGLHEPLALPMQYHKLCDLTANSLPALTAHYLYRDSQSISRHLAEIMSLEKYTWSLISALYSDRLHAQFENDSPPLLDMLSHVKHSERDIIHLLYEYDDELRESQIFIDWLERRVREHIEQVAERFECLFNQTTAWENTAHALNHLPPAELKRRILPSHLYPDVVYSTGAKLDAKDETDNDRYLNYLFLCIRGGDLSRAQRLCIQRGEYWRAVSFEGWRPFHCGAFSFSSPEYAMQADQPSAQTSNVLKLDPDVEMTKVDTKDCQVVGNTNRVLYKSICWWNSENTKLHPYERAIHAVFSGNVNVLVQLLPSSWTDLAWAHFRTSVEAKVDYNLRKYHQTGPRADNLTVTGRTQPSEMLHLPESAWRAKDWSPSDCLAKVESLLGWSPLACLRNASNAVTLDVVKRSVLSDFLLGSVSELPAGLAMSEKGVGNEASLSAVVHCIFYATQQAALLREYDDYLSAVAGVIPRLVRAALGNVDLDSSSGRLRPPSSTWTSGTKNVVACHVLRFLTHFVLFLREMEPGLPESPCSEIIKGYLCVLMADNHVDLIADYASTLPHVDAQIEWYASFLAGITEHGEREHCLSLAVTAGFDVQCLTRAIIRILRDRQLLLPTQSFSEAGTYSGAEVGQLNAIERARLASLLQEDKPDNLSEEDRMRISSLDWLFYDPRQRGEALIAANSLLRTFIAMNCLKAAEQLIARLPDGTLSRAKIICEDSGSPEWLVNTIREYECLVLYLESQEAFADWFRQAHSNKPQPPPELSAGLGASHHTSRALADRLRVEEMKKAYEAELQRWQHLLHLDAEVAAEKLTALLTYPSPGWLVDVSHALSKPAAATLESDPSDIDSLSNEAAAASNTLVGSDLAGLGDSAESRRLQMSVLRENCLTGAVWLLIRLYQKAGKHRSCVELGKLLADKQYGLYKLFSRVQLRQFFDHIKESIEHLIGTCGDPLGYVSVNANLSFVKSSTDIRSSRQSIDP